MKTPRIFILIGACAMTFCVATASMDALFSPAVAGELPIMRVDPRAGDPDEPDPAYSLPADDWDYSVGEVGLETSMLHEAQSDIRRFWAWLTNWSLFRIESRGR